MTSLETSHMKNVANELSIPLVTHTTHFDIRFGCYGNLNYCFSSGHVMADWTELLGQVFGPYVG
jgi:fructose/tagatose bisphosphate aldolase